MLYFINHAGNNYGLYCYDTQTAKVYSIHTSQNPKRRISIIKMNETQYRIYHYADAEKNKYSYNTVSISTEGEIKIDSHTVVNR